MSGTNFEIKVEILADLWMNYRDSEDFEDFIEYNDLGLPLAYAISNGIVERSSMAEQFINETFRLLLEGLGLQDTGFDSLEDLLNNGVTYFETYPEEPEEEEEE